jgi:hypothetical protein
MTTRQVIYAWHFLEFAMFFLLVGKSTDLGLIGVVLLAFGCMVSARFLVIGTIATIVSLRFSISSITLKQFWFLWWGEFEAFCILYFWQQAKPRKTNYKPQTIKKHHVILAHGFLCNDGFWYRLLPLLERNGYSVSSIELPNPFYSIDRFTELLEAEIDRVFSLKPNVGVTLIGFSMGGLAIRDLDTHLQPRVNAITIKTPHRGTHLACVPAFFGIPNGKEMSPGSFWINQLNSEVNNFKNAVGIFTAHDTIVIPAELGRPPFHPLKRKAKGHLHASIDKKLHRHLIRLLRVFTAS